MAYSKIVADNHSKWLKSREVIKKFNHWEVPSASRALGDISGLRQFMTPQGIGYLLS